MKIKNKRFAVDFYMGFGVGLVIAGVILLILLAM